MLQPANKLVSQAKTAKARIRVFLATGGFVPVLNDLIARKLTEGMRPIIPRNAAKASIFYLSSKAPGFLIEHYAGNFPLWLAPEQVRILPIGDEAALLEYARSIQIELRAHQVRCELDASSDHMKTKIANAEQIKVHTMLVIGNRDMEANAVSVRVHGRGNLGAKPRDEVIAELLEAIRERRAQ